MNELVVLELTRSAVMTLMMVSAPILLGVLVVGLLVSVFQAVTQVNEQTMVFVPKLIVAFLVLLVAGQWMGTQLLMFTVRLFTMLPEFAQ